MQKSAASLGQTQLVGHYARVIRPYIDSMNAGGALIVRTGKGRRENYSKDANLFIYTALNLATYKAALTASFAPAGSSTDDSKTLDAVFEIAEKEEVADFDVSDLNYEVSRLLKFLAQAVFLSEKSIMDQLVPADSPLRTEWDADHDGRIEVPLPPVATNYDPARWRAFQNVLRGEIDRGSPIGHAVLEILVRADHFVLTE